jgi:leader peptidase (prepilin peptidase)/N-methyltransferase
MIATVSGVALAALFGLALGSYAVTAGLRFARGEPSSQGRSHCDACDRTLGFVETLPVFSFVATSGRCRTCRGTIDPTHLAGELAGAVIVGTAFMTADPVRGLLSGVLGLVLLTSAVIDWKIGRLPDLLTTVVAGAGAGLAVQTSMEALTVGVASSIVTMLALLGLRFARRAFRKDPGLGLGDVKLAGALAIWLGLATPWMVAGAALASLLVLAPRAAPGERLPFGPALAIAGWSVGMAMEFSRWPTTA